MWTKSRYIAARDVSRGGLRVIWKSDGISEAIIDELDQHCLELITCDEKHPCIAVYPLKNDLFSIAVGVKIPGSVLESRPHEVIHGTVVDRKEFDFLNGHYIAAGTIERLFFPVPVDPLCPELWNIQEEAGCEDKDDCFGRFMKKMDYKTCLGLSHAVRVIGEGKRSIQLMVPEHRKMLTMAVLEAVAIYSHSPLFLMVNGECTLKNPDIVIADELNYLDQRKYEKMTWDELVHMEGCVEEAPSEQEDAAQMTAAYCIRYIEDSLVSEYEVYEKVQLLMEEDLSAYRRFLRMLRVELETCLVSGKQIRRFLKMLYLAYPEETPGSPPSPELKGAPYDFKSMYGFLKKYCISKRELKKYVSLLLEIQLEACMDQFSILEKRVMVYRSVTFYWRKNENQKKEEQ